MKKILLFIGLLVTVIAGAQSLPTIPGFTNINQKYQWVGMLPPFDTVYSKWGWARLNNVPYWGDGTSWHKSITYTPVNEQVGDQVITTGNGDFTNAPLTPKTGVVGSFTVIDNGNLNYTILWPQGYFIGGVYYFPGSGSVTLPVGTAGIDSGRVDLLEVTAAGAGSEQGDNSDNPQAPVPNLQTTIPVTTVLILSDATVAAPVNTSTNITVTNENLGQPNEAALSNVGSITYNANSTGHVFNGSKSIAFTAFANAARFDMTFDHLLNRADYTYVVGRIWITTAIPAAVNYSIRLFNGASFSNTVLITDWGINKTLTGVWQTFAIPIDRFTGNAQFNGISLTRSGTGGSVSFTMDYVQLQNSGVSVSGGPVTNIYNSDGTLTQNRFVNLGTKTLTFNNGSASFKNKDSIGNVFTYDFATNPVDATKITTAFTTGTFTPGSGHTVVAGTLGRNSNNSIELNYILGTDQWRIGGDFKPTAKSGTTYGFAVSIPLAGGMGIALTVNFDLADSACHISYQTGGVTPDFVTTNQHTSRFVYASTDSVKWWIERSRRDLVAVMHNYTTGDESVLNITGTVTHQPGKPRIYFYSGMTLFGNVYINDNGYRNPDAGIIGNSITGGSSAAYYAESWHEQYTSEMGFYTTIQASPAETSKEGFMRMTSMIASGTPLIVWDPGPNDANMDTLSKYLSLGVDLALAAGRKVILMTAIPNDGFSNVARNDTIKAIKSRKGANVFICDTYPSLVNPAGGTGMNPDYNVDGTHPNKYGQGKVVSLIVDATLRAGFPKKKNIFNVNLQSTTKGDYVKLTPHGLAVSYATVDPVYWPIQHEDWSANIPSTTGTLFSQYGNMFVGNEVRFGGQSWNSPIVNISTALNKMDVKNFSSYGFSSISGLQQFDATQIRLSSGTFFDFLTQAAIAQGRNWNSSTGLWEWTNVDDGFDPSVFNWLHIYKKVSGINTSLFKIKKNGKIWSHDSTAYSTGGYSFLVRNKLTGDYELLDSSGGGGGGGSGADAQLSNLSGTTAIPVALLPATDNALSFGSASKRWKTIFLDNTGTINFGNGNGVISNTSGAEITVAPADGTFRVWKSGAGGFGQFINGGFTEGIQINGQSNIIRSVTGSGNINLQTGASEKLAIGTGTPTSKLTVFGSFATAYATTATSLTLDATNGTIKVTATGQTITLPTAVGIDGRTYTIKLTASGSCTVATTSSQTIDGSTTYTALNAQYKYVTVQSDGANWIIIANN